jgi:hypothetical protein
MIGLVADHGRSMIGSQFVLLTGVAAELFSQA